MRFHGVRPLSLWVLIALSPGEIRGRVLKVKSYGSTTTICVSCFKVIERAVQHDEGGGVAPYWSALFLVKLYISKRFEF